MGKAGGESTLDVCRWGTYEEKTQAAKMVPSKPAGKIWEVQANRGDPENQIAEKKRDSAH